MTQGNPVGQPDVSFGVDAAHLYIYTSYELLKVGHTINDARELERTGPGYLRLTFLPPQLSASSSALRDGAPQLTSVPKGLAYLLEFFWVFWNCC